MRTTRRKKMPASLGQGTPAGDNNLTGVWGRQPHFITRRATWQTFRPVQDLDQLLALARWRAIRLADLGEYTRAALHLDLFYGLLRGMRTERR